MRAIKFQVPIYGFQVIVLISGVKEGFRWLKRKFNVDDDLDEVWLNQIDGGILRYNTKAGEGRYIIYINAEVLRRKVCDEPYLWSIITHEAFHLTIRIMQDAQVVCNPDDCESHAYLHGWLCGKVSPYIKREWDALAAERKKDNK